MKKLFALLEFAFGAAIMLGAFAGVGFYFLHSFADPLKQEYLGTWILGYLGAIFPFDVCLMVDAVMRWSEASRVAVTMPPA